MIKDREAEIETMARKVVQMKESSLRTAILIVDVLFARDQMDKEGSEKYGCNIRAYPRENKEAH